MIKAVVNMKRISYSLFFFSWTFTLYSCGVQSEEELERVAYDMRIDQFRTEEVIENKISWVLEAEVGYLYQGENKIVFDMLDIVFLSEGKENNTKVSSKNGYIFRDIGDIYLKKDVIVLASNGTKLETEALMWKKEEDKFYSEELVYVTYFNGDTVRGYGMEADKNLDVIEFKSDVSGNLNSSIR